MTEQPASGDPFASWFAQLEPRYLSRVTFQEARRALQALSTVYVQRRDKLPHGAVFAGEGKRAAFGFFYGPLHFLLARHIVRAVGADRLPLELVIDLGCGTGAVGAAWAGSLSPAPEVLGIDTEPWALQEAAWTYGAFGLTGRTRRGDASRVALPTRRAGIVAGFTVNELGERARETLLDGMLGAQREGAAVLVIEPIAARPVRWWSAWAERFRALGGRDDLWRFPAELPERLRLMDRAAGLNHERLTGRSLYLPPP